MNRNINYFMFLTCLVSLSVICRGSENPIKNVVVLMMENRTFDHMLGWMMEGGEFGNPDVNGLTGKECNYRDPWIHYFGKECVSRSAPDNSAYDLDHSHESTTQRVFTC